MTTQTLIPRKAAVKLRLVSIAAFASASAAAIGWAAKGGIGPSVPLVVLGVAAWAVAASMAIGTSEYNCNRCDLIYTSSILAVLAGFAVWAAVIGWGFKLFGGGPPAILVVLGAAAWVVAAGVLIVMQDRARDCPGCKSVEREYGEKPRFEGTRMNDRRVLPLLTYEEANIIPPRDSRVSPPASDPAGL